MSKPQPPAPPDPVATAKAQEGTNVGTNVAQQTMNNTNQVTPYGSTNFQQSGGYTDPQSGQWVPSFTETTSLNPTLQSVLSGTENAANRLVPTVNTLAGQAATSATTPLNPNGVNNNIIQAGPQALDQNATNSIYAGETALLDPTFQQQQRDLQDQLSRQGIGVGSEAYGNAETQLGTQQNQARLGALGTATGQGITAANNMFGLALQGQGQQLGQQQLLQSNPLALLSQIYGGSSPTAGAGQMTAV